MPVVVGNVPRESLTQGSLPRANEMLSVWSSDLESALRTVVSEVLRDEFTTEQNNLQKGLDELRLNVKRDVQEMLLLEGALGPSPLAPPGPLSVPPFGGVPVAPVAHQRAPSPAPSDFSYATSCETGSDDTSFSNRRTPRLRNLANPGKNNALPGAIQSPRSVNSQEESTSATTPKSKAGDRRKNSAGRAVPPRTLESRAKAPKKAPSILHVDPSSPKKSMMRSEPEATGGEAEATGEEPGKQDPETKSGEAASFKPPARSDTFVDAGADYEIMKPTTLLATANLRAKAMEDECQERKISRCSKQDKQREMVKKASITNSREFQALSRKSVNMGAGIVGQTLMEADRRRLSVHFVKEAVSGAISCRDIVTSMAFDNITGLAVVVNAVTIGLQTDYMAAHETDTVPLPLEVVDKVLAVYFFVELLLRLWVWRLEFFFHAKDWSWNIFDFFLVTMHVAEESMRVFVALAQVDGADMSSLKIMRVLRVLRLIRVIRVVRIMRLINELRTIIASVLGSLKALFWTVVLLMLLMYSVGIYFCQTVTDHRVAVAPNPVQGVFMERYSSVQVSIYTLYLAISGGMDWQSISDPIFDHIATLPGVVFVLYIAFVMLCIMNVVTGVFVESALKNAHYEDEVYMVRVLRKIFLCNDIDSDGQLTWEEFSEAVESKDMELYFRSIDLDPSDAVNLFFLIDVEDSGEVDLMDFVSQCTRLRGHAKAIDVMTVLYEARKLARAFLLHSERVEAQLEGLEHSISYLQGKTVKG